MPYLLLVTQRWECPNCTYTDETHEARPHLRVHPCARFSGLSMPMVPAGTRCKVEVREREDYVGKEDVFLHEGRPIMAIVTTRDDGTDCMVFAPTARASTRGE